MNNLFMALRITIQDNSTETNTIKDTIIVTRSIYIDRRLQDLKEVSIDILRSISSFIIEDEDMAMPFPDAVTRGDIITKDDTDTVATNRNGSTRIRSERFFTGIREDDLYDLCLE